MRARVLLPLLFVSALAAACGDAPPAPAPPDPSIAARAALEERLATEPDGPERVQLEIELAVVGLQGVRGREDWPLRLSVAVGELGRLAEAKRVAGDADAEARVRVAYGRHLSMTKAYADADAQLTRALDHAAGTPLGAAALTELASNLYRQGDFAGSKALLERVVREYPGTPEAEQAPAGIRNCELRQRD